MISAIILGAELIVALSMMMVAFAMIFGAVAIAYEIESRQSKRLGLSRSVLRAERQIYDLAADAFDRMLEEARASNGDVLPELLRDEHENSGS